MNMDTLGLVLVFCAGACMFFVFAQVGQKALLSLEQRYAGAAGAKLTEMLLFVDPRMLFSFNALAFVLGPLIVWMLTSNVLFAALSAIALGFFPRAYLKRMREKRLTRFDEQLPDALAMMASAMRAGSSLNMALEGMVREQTPPLSQEFALLLRELRLGVDMDIALTHMSNRIPTMDFRLAVSAIRIAREVGGNLSESLEKLSDAVRSRQIMERKIKALTAQGRVQGIVMAALPFGLMGILSLMEADAMSAMFNTWPGWLVFGFICIWIYFGYLVMKKILSIDV